MSNDKKPNFRETLNLPRTDFPIRAQSAIFDPQVLKRWEDEKLSEKTFTHNQGKEKFILHDGPPYANGDIHLGHAFNKILKDIVAKSERMSGKHVPIIPGWDCHGLPIELKVTEFSDRELSREQLLKECRAYAQKWVDVQKQSFKDLGVQMYWDKPYLTMSKEYESKILKAFAQFVQKGYVKRHKKTVPWCPSCATVLANAEIEYEDRKDPSIYVQFPLSQDLTESLFPEAGDREVSMLIWTTTPWTLPLNRAVVIRPGAEYQLVAMNDKLVILAKELVKNVSEVSKYDATVLKTFKAEELTGKQVEHPFVQNLSVPIIGDQLASLEDGTACVHSAPGCGPDDYNIGIQHNLEIYSPITVDGKYSDEIEPKELEGMPVADGQIWVIKKLAKLDRLFFKQSIRHSYPHCWRCHKGLIFRATSQWFCDLSKDGLRDKALKEIDNITMLPKTGENRFKATLEGRLEWCLSRQRIWGVPIPAVRCLESGEVKTSVALINQVAQGVAQEGIEYWDKVAIEDLCLDSAEALTSDKFEKEYDILDVWFESGVSHYAVLHDNDQVYPANVYLEGKDQHRAWFQSSLLTSLVLEGSTPTKSIVTHGFTVDKDGKKMSKSLGNVVTPQEIVDQIGLDGLRLWVASNDYASDPVYSDVLVKNVSEVLRKVRNTCRFLLSNLYDFDINTDAVSVEDMLAIDKYALVRVHQFNEVVKNAYEERKTTTVFHELADFCVKDLSSFYLDIVKDRLYVEQADGLMRRSAQTACYYILDMLTKAMAPILSVNAELISDLYQKDKKESIHLQDFAATQHLMNLVIHQFKSFSLPSAYRFATKDFCDIEFIAMWEQLDMIRDAVLKKLEGLRSQDVIRHSLDASVELHISESFEGYKQLQVLFDSLSSQMQYQTLDQFLKEYLIVSHVSVFNDEQGDQILPGVFAKIEKASGEKCVRCWQWTQDISNSLCPRCATIVE